MTRKTLAPLGLPEPPVSSPLLGSRLAAGQSPTWQEGWSLAAPELEFLYGVLVSILQNTALYSVSSTTTFYYLSLNNGHSDCPNSPKHTDNINKQWNESGGGRGRQPAPSKSIPKTTSSPGVREEIPTIGSQHSLNTLEKIKRHLVTVLTLKSLETVFALKRVSKDSHFVQKDFPVFFFLAQLFP